MSKCNTVYYTLWHYLPSSWYIVNIDTKTTVVLKDVRQLCQCSIARVGVSGVGCVDEA